MHTQAQKHNCLPFLLARSSFRGLSKNMASEEDAFKRQEKHRLRATDLPLLWTCCCLGPGRALHTETSTTPRRLPNTTVYRIFLLERNWKLLYSTKSILLPIPAHSISLLPILQIKSACRNNCVQYRDRLGKGCYFHFLYVKLLEKRKHMLIRGYGRKQRRAGSLLCCVVVTNLGVSSFIINSMRALLSQYPLGG